MKGIKLMALLCISFMLINTSEAKMNSKAKSALEKKVSKTIVCSPNGNEDGSVSMPEGLKKLKRGMLLKLLPGDYKNKEYKINLDSLIIEGVPGEECNNLRLELSGRNNIIRNLWMTYLKPLNSLTIVNSIIEQQIYVSASSKMKFDLLFENCLLAYFYIYDYYGKSKIEINNCTLIQNSSSSEVIDISYDATIFIGNSILYSKSAIFECSGYRDIPEIKIQDSIVHFETQLGSFDNTSSTKKKKNATIFDFKDMRDICKPRACTKNEIKKLKFASTTIKPANCQPKTPFADKGAHFGREWFEDYEEDEVEDDNDKAPEDETADNADSIAGNLSDDDLISIDPKDGFFQNQTSSSVEYSSKSISIVKGKYSRRLKSIKKYKNFELEYDMNLSKNMGKYYVYLIFRRDDDFSCKITFSERENRYYVTTLNKSYFPQNIDCKLKNKNKIYLLCKDNTAMLRINGEVVANIKLSNLSEAGRFEFYGSSRSDSSNTIKIENIKFKNLDE